MFEVWHPDAVKLFSKSVSLRRVCHELWDWNYRLPDSETNVSVFSPFQPQLASATKKDFETVVKCMGGEAFWMEEKLDGERLQLHKRGDEFQWFSRKAHDYTDLYGASYDEGGLTKFLRNAFDKRVYSIVLDGEMVAWSANLQAPMPFGSLKSAATASRDGASDEHNQHPYFIVYDILHLNGTNLTNQTLSERRRICTQILRPSLNRFDIIAHTVATRPKEIEDRLKECVARATEGLVVKNPNSLYRLNDRNESWIKVKPEYMSEYGEELDVLVIAAYYGTGRRSGILSSYLCGLRDDTDPKKRRRHSQRHPQSQAPASSQSQADGGGQPRPFFHSFVRVGGGFNAEDYAKIHEITDGKWEDFNPRRPPSEYYAFATNTAGTVIESPDKWIRPEDSVVLQLKAAQVTESDSYATGYTLRFPRFERRRHDRDWTNSMGIDEFQRVDEEAKQKRAQKKMQVHQRRTGRRPATNKRKLHILGDDLIDQQSEIEPSQASQRGVFEGVEFFIPADGNKIKRAALAALVGKHGGTIIAAPRQLEARRQDNDDGSDVEADEETQSGGGTICICDRQILKVEALIASGRHDIYKYDWLIGLCELADAAENMSPGDRAAARADIRDEIAGRMPIATTAFLHTTEATQRRIERQIDDVLVDDLAALNWSTEKTTKIEPEVGVKGKATVAKATATKSVSVVDRRSAVAQALSRRYITLQAVEAAVRALPVEGLAELHLENEAAHLKQKMRESCAESELPLWLFDGVVAYFSTVLGDPAARGGRGKTRAVKLETTDDNDGQYNILNDDNDDDDEEVWARKLAAQQAALDLDLARMSLLCRGAVEAVDLHDPALTHVVFLAALRSGEKTHSDKERAASADRLENLRRLLSMRDTDAQPRIVQSAWIGDCVASATRLAESRYAP